jgi:hypothetical protein
MTPETAKSTVLKQYPLAAVGTYGDILSTFAIGTPDNTGLKILSPVCPDEGSAWIFAANRILQEKQLLAAQTLCKIYFDIASELVGEDKVRAIRDSKIDNSSI